MEEGNKQERVGKEKGIYDTLYGQKSTHYDAIQSCGEETRQKQPFLQKASSRGTNAE